MSEGNTRRPHINCKIVRETGAAYLVDDGTLQVWVPKSQCEAYLKEDGTYDLFAEEWILKKKGLV
jgi:hypothetical protein